MIQKGHFQTQMKYWTIGGGVQRRVPPPPGKKDHEIFASTWGKLAPSLSYRGPENLQRVAAKNRNWWNCEIWTPFLETQNFEPFLINMVRKIFYPLTGGLRRLRYTIDWGPFWLSNSDHGTTFLLKLHICP
jgi:hypothetical protein